MPRQTKHISISGEIVDIDKFSENFDRYFPMVVDRFRVTTLERSAIMPRSDFIALIFNRLYKKADFSVLNTVNTAENQILQALDIDIITHNVKSSKIIFKSSNNVYRIKNETLDDLIHAIKKGVSYSKSKLDLRFGIELEFVADRDCKYSFNEAMRSLLKDRYIDRGIYNKNNGEMWILGCDCSIKYRSSSQSGYELTSPIFHFNEHDLNELKTVLDLIKNVFHGKVNSSCGTHVHISFDVPTYVTALFCKHIARSYARNEKSLFDKLVPKSRREDNSRWCRHTSVIYYRRSRYQKLNFINTELNTTNLHLEFRQLNGTLDYDKIVSWLKLQKLFVEIAVKSYNESHTELSDCISDVVKMPIEDVVCSNEFSSNEIESLLKESKYIS